MGSEQKIDATYLSPTVNMTSRLESATRQYGVSIIMSEQFYDQLSSSRPRCRRIDCVAVKGSQEALQLRSFCMGVDARDMVKESDKYYNLYIAGDWQGCKIELDSFFARWPTDGPARAVWEFLEENDFVAPIDWKGFRKLKNK